MTGPVRREKKEAVHERDQQRCANCRRHRDEVDKLDVHHIVPRGQGGSHCYSNLISLCRDCHEAAGGDRMAPRVKIFSNGAMDEFEFELFKELFNSVDLARFDEDEGCWYLPCGDVEKMLESVGNDQESGVELTDYM